MIGDSLTLELVCPRDHTRLEAVSDQEMRCAECGRSYPVHNGIVSVLDAPNAFYEGAYLNQTRFLPKSERIWHAWPLWLLVNGYPWMVRRHVPEGARVVELGCASGVAYFGKRYRMVGCDLSMVSLKGLPYQQRVQCDAGDCIPLPDGAVDAVVSSYFWEHIPPQTKSRILAECRRVLKPGGKIIFLYDVETDNPLIRHYKSVDPALYKRQFIDGDGHYGYERPRDNQSTFEAGGFRIIEHRGLEKTWFQSPAAYVKLRAYEDRLERLFALGSAMGRSPWFYLYTGFMRLLDTAVCPVLPEDWARIELVVCERAAD